MVKCGLIMILIGIVFLVITGNPSWIINVTGFLSKKLSIDVDSGLVDSFISAFGFLLVIIGVLVVLVGISKSIRKPRYSVAPQQKGKRWKRLSRVQKNAYKEGVIRALDAYTNYEDACFHVNSSVMIWFNMIVLHKGDDGCCLEAKVLTYDAFENSTCWAESSLNAAKEVFSCFFSQVSPSEAGFTNYKYEEEFYRIPMTQIEKIVRKAVKEFNKRNPSHRIRGRGNSYDRSCDKTKK